ncbi:MAG: alcohol dehydrogenase catalytic domain-containing protein [Treponema sp.]|jgi:threonine dehydrogenase-like Zn-dependent dehydrogenase|nr:alcohol dehydrogenase catalytic domain-containing protein [Treponema sp.]
MMKVLCLPQKGELVIRDIPKPRLEAGHALIKIETCGICGSDVTAYQGINPTLKYPVEGIGHEGTGIIEEIGDNDKDLKPGDRVVLEPYVPCNECPMCKVKRFNNCENLKVCGVHKNGMMVEYFQHPLQLLYKLPDTLDSHSAVLVEPLTIGLHALNRAKVKAGEYCVVFGAGTIGLLTAFGCLNYGAVPVLIDVLQKRLNQAKEMGIPHTYNSTEGKTEDYLRDVCDGPLPDAMIDCTGSPPVIANMHNMVRHGGRISLVGWPHDPVIINTIRCMQKELNIYPCRNSNAKFPESINMVSGGRIPADRIITKMIGFEETESAIQDMIKNPINYLKVAVTINT